MGESSRLSLTTAGSSMNTALGNVSAGGMGTPEFDVTHKGGGPCEFVAIQPRGNVGGVTLSKFSLHITGRKHGGEHEGVGCNVAPICDKPSSPKAITIAVKMVKLVAACIDLTRRR